MAQHERAKSISFTPHPKVLAHLDTLVAYGLFGRNRADVVNRLVCEGIERRVEPFKIPLRKG